MCIPFKKWLRFETETETHILKRCILLSIWQLTRKRFNVSAFQYRVCRVHIYLLLYITILYIDSYNL